MTRIIGQAVMERNSLKTSVRKGNVAGWTAECFSRQCAVFLRPPLSETTLHRNRLPRGFHEPRRTTFFRIPASALLTSFGNMNPGR